MAEEACHVVTSTTRFGLTQALDLTGEFRTVIQTEYTPRIKPCKKCRSALRKTGEFRASGGLISSFFDFATERFTYVSCGGCGYTEFYNVKLGTGSRIVDFLGD